MGVLIFALLFTSPAGDGSVFDFPAKVAQTPALAAVGEKMRLHKVLRAQFDQEKKIRVLRRPLRSSGFFMFATQHGILWRTDKPFDSRFVITPSAIRQQSQGSDLIEIQAQDHPFIHGVTNVFMSLFQGDTAELEQQFDLYFQGNSDAWTIGLKPKKMVMKKLISQIVLVGGATIESVTFEETSGDTTQIMFRDIATQPAELSADERVWFGD